MNNSRILLSAVVAGFLYSNALANPYGSGGTLIGQTYTGTGDVKVYYDINQCQNCTDLNTQKSKIVGSNGSNAKVELNGKSKDEQLETQYITGALITNADKSASNNEVRLNYVKITGSSSPTDPTGAGHVIGGAIGNIQYDNKTANISTNTGSVTNNKVYIKGSTLSGTYEENFILFTTKIKMAQMEIEIPGGNARAMNMAVLGGAKLVKTGSNDEAQGVTNNYVEIVDSNIFGVVAGGFSSANVVKGNSVSIENSKLSGIQESSVVNPLTRQPTTLKTLSDGDVVGGMSVSGLATENKVTLKNVTNNLDSDLKNNITILGSFSGDTQNATQKNNVFIEGGSLDLSGGLEGAVIGGFGMGGAEESQVSIKNATITTATNSGDDKADPSYMKGGINGGIATSNKASNNKVIIENSTINGGDISGGRMVGSGTFGNGVVEGNKVSITNSTINADIYGGQNYLKDANSNKIEIIGGKISSKQIMGAKSTKGNANNNEVKIIGNTVSSVFGGKSSEGSTNNNIVNISGNSGLVTGGEGKTGADGNKISIGGNAGDNITGGKTQTGSASNNTINIGGNSSANIIAAQSANGDTNNNEISVNGDVGGNIYAGFDGTDSKGNNNIINLLGATKVGGDVKVGSQDGSGNTLNISANSPIKISGNVGGAQNININVSNIAPGDAVLSVGSINVEKTDINADLKLAQNFYAGDSLRLISGNVVGTPNSANAVVTKGGTVEYSIDVDKNDLTKELQVKAKGIKPTTKMLSEGVMGSAMTLVTASDGIANQAVNKALSVTSSATSGATIIAPFGSIMGGTNRVETGSYVRANGINLAFGAAVGKITDSGKLTIGPFIEFGLSSYTTHNDFGYGDVKGDGDTKYIGAGALVRYDFGGTESSRPYAEVSARMGKNYNSYENKNLQDGFGNHAKYDMDTNYYGAHIGAGYVYKKDNHSLDLYAKYFYTRLGGDNIDIMDVPYDFDAIKSHRILTGAKYKIDIETNKNIKVAPFVGAAFDYEFKGDGNAYATGFAVDSPTLKGGSAMFEAGVSLGGKNGLSVDLGARGYAGKRRGINGLLNINFDF